MKKRFITAKAVLISACMAVISITAGSSALPQAAADEYEESGIKLRVYDCETGEESIEVFHPIGNVPLEIEDVSTDLPDVDDGGGISPQIVGTDDRVRVTTTTVAPYSYTCYMYNVYKDGTKSKPYSGFMIGRSTAVTAGHCITIDEQPIDYVVVIPGKNGDYHPYGEAYSTKIAISDGYFVDGNPEDDWAVMKLDRNIGSQSKWAQLKCKAGSYNGTAVENIGYPGKSGYPLQNNDSSNMIRGKGTIRSSSGNIFNRGRELMKGDWDASKGNSGGPVIANDSSDGRVVIGILTYGSTISGQPYGDNSCYSAATRISSDMYEIFMSYC